MPSHWRQSTQHCCVTFTFTYLVTVHQLTFKTRDLAISNWSMVVNWGASPSASVQHLMTFNLIWVLLLWRFDFPDSFTGSTLFNTLIQYYIRSTPNCNCCYNTTKSNCCKLLQHYFLQFINFTSCYSWNFCLPILVANYNKNATLTPKALLLNSSVSRWLQK